MTSRTRYRVVGIAALITATAATAVLVVMSQGSSSRVTPLREEATKHHPTDKPRDYPGLGTRWRVPPRQAPMHRTDGASDRRRKHELPPLPERRPAAKPRVKREERTSHTRSPNSSEPHRDRTAPRALTVPTPGTAPTALSTPPAPPLPAPSEQSATQPSSLPVTTPTPDARPDEIEIDGREFETELDPAHSHDRQLRLRNRSGQFIVIDIDEGKMSRSLPPGGEALIGLDRPSSKGFEVELRRRNGVLVLRLHD